MFGIINRLEEKLDLALGNQEKIIKLLEELRDHPETDKLQEGINNILGYGGPKGGSAE